MKNFLMWCTIPLFIGLCILAAFFIWELQLTALTNGYVKGLPGILSILLSALMLISYMVFSFRNAMDARKHLDDIRPGHIPAKDWLYYLLWSKVNYIVMLLHASIVATLLICFATLALFGQAERFEGLVLLSIIALFFSVAITLFYEDITYKTYI